MNARAQVAGDLPRRLAEIVGERGIITDVADMAPYLADWRDLYKGSAIAVVRPASTAEVAAVVRLCAETRTPVVPQGGNTGMCGAATPDAAGTAVVVALGRMNKIIDVNALNNTMTVEAGCILANIQQAAADVDRLFPLSLGGEGSCVIGGNISTNAGGINVLRYGNTRDLVLGLEAVLPDGRVWNGLRGLRKDNTGYDLKHLFIGAEGTLGIITQAVLKLFPRPHGNVTAFAGITDPAHAVELLALLRAQCGDGISAFELISRNCLEMVVRRIPGTRDPLAAPYPWYVLTELTDAQDGSALRATVEQALSAGIERGLVQDVAIPENAAQSKALWRMRESIPDAAKVEGLVYRHDIAVAVSRIPEFIATASAALAAAFPGVRIICFGHLGDGNLHFNAFVPGRERSDEVARRMNDVNRLVHDIVQTFGGSISAEHGIGQSKRDELAHYKSATELDLMRIVKKALDPHNLMNPGKDRDPDASLKAKRVAELTHEDVQRIIRIIDEMDDRDVHLEIGDLKLHVTRNGAPTHAIPATAARATPAPSPAAAAPVKPASAPALEVPPGHIAIRAPTMGTFYRASSPGAKPHAEIGDRVQPDDTVGVFEVMKLFTTLKAGVAGTIAAIPVSNEAMVEADQVLIIIKPDN